MTASGADYVPFLFFIFLFLSAIYWLIILSPLSTSFNFSYLKARYYQIY